MMKVKLFEECGSELLEDAINDFFEKEEPMSIEKIKYQVTPWNTSDSGLLFSALVVYEKYDKDDLLQVRDQVLDDINYGIKNDENV
ncbi:sporulation protein Cse60 [Lactobacillus sp.]|uniref:sporulation protein Cse60 n=1 Tax=Lactobacillus sp. TaxID=1591 RepID=UPI002628E81A|nr:sporulation protein Cse60 [Lactobacillus sp.]